MPAPAPRIKEGPETNIHNNAPLNTLILPPRSTSLDSGPPIVRTIIEGDPAVGTIHYLRQTHSIYTEEKPELIEIGRFQHEMLKVLEEGQFRHVFAEGLVRNFNLSDPKDIRECGVYHFKILNIKTELIGSPNDPERFVEWTRELFTSSGYPNLSADSTKRDQQLITLGILGAHFVYGCMNPAVTLHRTISPRLDDGLYKRQKALSASIEERKIAPHPYDESQSPEESQRLVRFLRFIPRERKAMREIAAHLEKNPGDSIAVIFGLYHDLTAARDHIWENPPVLHDISFVQAFREYLGWKAERLLR